MYEPRKPFPGKLLPCPLEKILTPYSVYTVTYFSFIVQIFPDTFYGNNSESSLQVISVLFFSCFEEISDVTIAWQSSVC